MTLPELQIDPRVAQCGAKLTDERGPDPVGHYELLLPERFRPVDLPPATPSNLHSPVQVALFQTLGEPLAELEITGIFLRREIAPADVLEALLGPSRTIVESRRVPSPGGDLLDVLTRQVGDVPSLARWWTVKDGGADGGRLYVLEARTAASDYPVFADPFTSMLASFRLLNPTPWDYNERLSQLARKTPNDILCFYPESWQLEEVSDGSDGPFVANLWQVVGDKLLGRLSLVSQRDEESPDALIERHAESLGAPVSWAPIEDAEPFGGLERGWLRRGRTMLGEAAADVRVYVTQGRGMTVLLGLAGVPAREDPLAAASMRRAAEIIRETFRIA